MPQPDILLSIHAKENPGTWPGLCHLNGVADDQAADTAALRFLSQPSSPSTPKSVAKSRSAAVNVQLTYCAIRRLERLVPICWNVATIWFADVNRKNLLESVAQVFRRFDVGSPPVLTWIV